MELRVLVLNNLEETVEHIRTISEIALLTLPDYDVEAICNKLMEQDHN